MNWRTREALRGVLVFIAVLAAVAAFMTILIAAGQCADFHR